MNTLMYVSEDLEEEEGEVLTIEVTGLNFTVLAASTDIRERVKTRFFDKFSEIIPELVTSENGEIEINWENLKANALKVEDKITLLGSLGVLSDELEGNWRVVNLLPGNNVVLSVPVPNSSMRYRKPWKYYFTRKKYALNFIKSLRTGSFSKFEVRRISEVVSSNELDEE